MSKKLPVNIQKCDLQNFLWCSLVGLVVVQSTDHMTFAIDTMTPSVTSTVDKASCYSIRTIIVMRTMAVMNLMQRKQMNFSTNWWRCLKLCTAAVKTLADNLGFPGSRYQIMLYVTRFPSSLLWSCSIEMFYDLRETRFCFNNIEKTPDQDLQMH